MFTLVVAVPWLGSPPRSVGIFFNGSFEKYLVSAIDLLICITSSPSDNFQLSILLSVAFALPYLKIRSTKSLSTSISFSFSPAHYLPRYESQHL
jgi:hypothetical protein